MTCLLMGSLLQILKVAARFFEILPENGDPLLLQIFFIQSTLGAFFAFIFLMMFASMIADIADEQELNNGLRQEGVFSGGITFSNKATSGLGAMGYGLPAAIGACLANKSQPMFALDGEGGLQLNIQEKMANME